MLLIICVHWWCLEVIAGQRSCHSSRRGSKVSTGEYCLPYEPSLTGLYFKGFSKQQLVLSEMLEVHEQGIFVVSITTVVWCEWLDISKHFHCEIQAPQVFKNCIYED